ncbi:MAG: RNA polymerase sigma factor [Clostridiales Family XIII bacterium]|jgi:RNA polymerase sigma-70 factor (ECF subfamily)|nr:RNA polymerase sigma factor [Clostridiales Family XIII bacterium]
MTDNRAFFEEIYEAYGLDVKRFIFATARRDAQITEDVFQNTWENAWRYIGSLRERSKAKAWLFGIARNEAARYFTKKHIKHEFPANAGAGSGDGDSGDGRTAAITEIEDTQSTAFPERFADESLLTELISHLPEEEQQLLIMHYGYGVSISEISRMYGTNYNTLKSIIRRAVIRLREISKGAENE